MVRSAPTLVVAWVLAGAAHAAAQTPQQTAPTEKAAAEKVETPGDDTVRLRYSLKGSGLFSRFAHDPVLFPDRASAASFWRCRVEPTIRISDDTTVEFAIEQRVRASSSASGFTGAGVLPAEAPAPYRLRQLDWQLWSSTQGEWRAEVDRAALHARAGAAEFTVGRQAIGWGRGVMFGAIDLFSPFTPLEADREWRRGVDAVRADVKVSDRVSVDGIGAFGTDVDHSVLAGRLRGFAGDVDLELVGGRRARDLFGGLASSAAVGDAEVHTELAVFRTPAVPGSASFADQRSVVKVVAGGSYRLPVGAGLVAYGEYHYSGFGAASAGGALRELADRTFQERYLRGDTQILGRHAVATLASYELSPEVSLAAEWLMSPRDGSGVAVPSITLTFGDRVSMVMSGYVPHGRTPDGPTLRSDFGATPLAAFVQLRVYR